MDIGIYGGSFDPPHIGHALVAGWLLWTQRVDQVWLLPTYKHAFGKRSAPFDRRVSMCRALAQDVAPTRIVVCEIERDLPEPSYTIDTLKHLSAKHPAHRFRLVVGADVVPQTPRWKDWASIEADFSPIVVGRDGYPPPPEAVVFPGVSSTDIRDRLERGLPIDHLVPSGVAKILEAS